MKYLLLLLPLILVNCASPGGIGVLYNKKGVVKHVFENSPANAAGIMLEDVLLNKKDLRGKIGTICRVRWQRGTVLHERDIIRADVSTFRGQDYGTFDNTK
jgi:hypothetical protein